MANTNGLDHVRYVVVVHGIGDQRKNETVLAAIDRFAEARAGATKAEKADVLTLGMLSGQTTDINQLSGRPQPWIEFEDIPCSPDGRPNGPFLPRRVIGDEGENIRFVDVCWADIMKCDFPQVGETVGAWSSSLVERLKKHPQCPGWALRLIVIMRKAVLLVEKLMLLKFSNLADKIFNQFLGDVQLYGEYGPCRGQAVRRFHEIMADVQATHDLEQEERFPKGKCRKTARYTIVAHSLGTVMTLDALLYACAVPSRPKDQVRFAGYLREGESESQNPLSSTKRWIANVDALVTLGSPVDKYLVLWWLNYEYLADDSWISMPVRDGGEHKIKLFNYSDEQDPVGGELDVAHMTPAVQKLFSKAEDLVFTRYPVPGVAHADYWKDLDLFKEIAKRAVDEVGETTERTDGLKPFLFEKYVLALVYSYVLIPVAFWGGLSFCATLAVYTTSWHTRMIAVITCAVLLYLATQVFHFVIEGRQAVIYKIQSSVWQRKLSALLLPGLYVGVIYNAGNWARSQSDPLVGCYQRIEAALYATAFWAGLAECDPLKFIVSGLGLSVALYGLSVYLFFTWRNRKPERIHSYKDYVKAAKHGATKEDRSVQPLDFPTGGLTDAAPGELSIEVRHG